MQLSVSALQFKAHPVSVTPGNSLLPVRSMLPAPVGVSICTIIQLHSYTNCLAAFFSSFFQCARFFLIRPYGHTAHVEPFNYPHIDSTTGWVGALAVISLQGLCQAFETNGGTLLFADSRPTYSFLQPPSITLLLLFMNGLCLLFPNCQCRRGDDTDARHTRRLEAAAEGSQMWKEAISKRFQRTCFHPLWTKMSIPGPDLVFETSLGESRRPISYGNLSSIRSSCFFHVLLLQYPFLTCVYKGGRHYSARFGWDSPSKVIGTIYNGFVIYENC